MGRVLVSQCDLSDDPIEMLSSLFHVQTAEWRGVCSGTLWGYNIREQPVVPMRGHTLSKCAADSHHIDSPTHRPEGFFLLSR